MRETTAYQKQKMRDFDHYPAFHYLYITQNFDSHQIVQPVMFLENFCVGPQF